MPAAVGPTETNKGTDWSNRICRKKITIRKKTNSLRNDNFMSRGLQRASTKIGNIFTLYHRELMKGPILCMFCTVCSPRVNAFFLATEHFSKQKTNIYSLCSTALCVCSSQGRKGNFCSISINILCVTVCGLLHCRSYGKTGVHGPSVV